MKKKETKNFRVRMKKEFGLCVVILTPGVVRLIDGNNRRLDLYKKRYHDIDTGKRGFYNTSTLDALLTDTFILNQ